MQQAADLYKCLEEIVRIRRAIISAIIALSAAGSIAAGSALPAAAATAPAVTHATPLGWYHG
jgi:hypothetical protein